MSYPLLTGNPGAARRGAYQETGWAHGVVVRDTVAKAANVI